jgi:hypothetical protein
VETARLPRLTRREFLRRLTVSTAVTALIVAAIPAMMFAATFGTCVLPKPTTFVGLLWKLGGGGRACSFRYEMLGDLRSDRLRPGMSRADVVSLLGEPTPGGMEYFPDGDGVAYVAGCWIDCYWLVLQFNEDDRLTAADVYQD